MLKIALSRGRVFEEEIELLKKIGYELKPEGRELHLRCNDILFWFLKPKDVPVWVESGVVDLGMVGLDVIREKEFDVLEVLDLKIGKCRFSFACKKEDADIFRLSSLPLKKHITIATKFPELARKFAREYFSNFDIIHLHGSVEVAPHVGLADMIADIISTGRTLRENGLVEIKKLMDISTYLICNRNSFNIKYNDVKKFVLKISGAIGERITFISL